MVNEELVAYIRAQVESGISRDEITLVLKNEGGWSDEDILGAFAMVGSSPEKKDSDQSVVVQQTPTEVKEETMSAKEGEEQDDEEKKKGLLVPIVIVVMLFGLGIGGYVAYKMFGTSSVDEIAPAETAEEEMVVEEEVLSHIEEDTTVSPDMFLSDEEESQHATGFIESLNEAVVMPTQVMNTPVVMDVFDIESDGTFQVPVDPEMVNVIAAMFPEKDFGFMKIMSPSDFENKEDIILNAQSTAVAAVFMSPFFTSSDPEVAEPILEIIRNNAEMEAFAATIAERVVVVDVLLEDEEYLEAFSVAIESALTEMNASEDEEED